MLEARRWLCSGRLAPWIGAALVFLILFVRKPDAFVNPQLWAEDGTVFFAQQVQLGALAHLEPYAGYYNEIPRIVASLAGLLPHRFAPAVYSSAALLVLLALVLKLYSPRLELPGNPLPYALAAVLVPHPGGEVFARLANVQWIFALLLLTVVLQESPKTRAQAAGDVLLVLAAGLTGPFVFFALPLLAWKIWRRRTEQGFRLKLPVLGAAAGAAVIQLQALLHSSLEAPPPLPAAPDVWVRLVGHRLFGTLFLGPLTTYRLNPILVAALGILALGGVLWALRRSPVSFERACLSLAFAAAVIAGAFAKYADSPSLLIPWANASRYFYIPAVVVAWCLLFALATVQGIPRLLAVTALAALLSSSALSLFRTPPLKDLWWEEEAERIGGPEDDVWIPIHPQGWMIHIRQD